MANLKLSGTGVALITPFNKKGKVDLDGVAAMVNHVIAGGKGVDYIVALGTTGETATLEPKEKLDVFNCIRDTNKGRVPLVAGFGGNDTSKLIKEIESFDFKGFQAILSVSPYYNKPTQEGIFRHYEAVAKASPLPVITYNVPGRTGSNVLAKTTLRLAKEMKNIIAVKEASGNFDQCMEIIRDKPKGFTVISGDDPYTLPYISVGMEGVISVVANAFPIEFSDMVRLALKGDYEKARKIHYSLLHITSLFFAEGNPGGVKCCLDLMGVCKDHVRMPLVPVSDELRKKMKAALKEIKS